MGFRFPTHFRFMVTDKSKARPPTLQAKQREGGEPHAESEPSRAENTRGEISCWNCLLKDLLHISPE